MSEDRAYVVMFPWGTIRWVIERANGNLEWMRPCGDNLVDTTDQQKEWLRLWNRSAATENAQGTENVLQVLTEAAVETGATIQMRQPVWYGDCEILTDYMPPYPDEKTVPSGAVVRHIPSGTFLRYSQGPRQGHFWDLYGDNYHDEKLARLALSQAPPPPRKSPIVKLTMDLGTGGPEEQAKNTIQDLRDSQRYAHKLEDDLEKVVDKARTADNLSRQVDALGERIEAMKATALEVAADLEKQIAWASDPSNGDLPDFEGWVNDSNISDLPGRLREMAKPPGLMFPDRPVMPRKDAAFSGPAVAWIVEGTDTELGFTVCATREEADRHINPPATVLHVVPVHGEPEQPEGIECHACGQSIYEETPELCPLDHGVLRKAFPRD